MFKGEKVTPPFFEIGPKAYLYGEGALRLAQHADKMSRKYDVSVIFTPQYVDIPIIVNNTKNLFIFAQHMDPIRIGRGIGSVLPEAVKAAGAKGVLLNHAEKKLDRDTLVQTNERADEVGLITMVCADNGDEAVGIAKYSPNIIVVESPALIGTGKRSGNDEVEIGRINQSIWDINPDILILHGAGISKGSDVYNIISLGSQGAGSTSGIILADDPFAMMEEMIHAGRNAWDKRHSIK